MAGVNDPNCIFCKIVAGAIPSRKLYEDEAAYAFLDIGPLSDGHCLVIPKKHFVTIDQMSADEFAACVRILPALSRVLKQVTDAEGWNVLQNNGAVAGQVVMHVHFHLIPRVEGDELGYRWPAGKLDPKRGDELQEAITKGLRSA